MLSDTVYFLFMNMPVDIVDVVDIVDNHPQAGAGGPHLSGSAWIS